MKTHYAAYLLIIVVFRLTSVFVVLELVYSTATTSLTMPSGMGGMISGFMFRVGLVRVVAAILLWFIARPVGKLILNDIDSAKGGTE
jgi:hypothetical protein